MTDMLDTLLRDLRSARRMLAARPAWTAAAILCLAIAMGANTAGFTLVNGLLLRSLPFAEPERLVTVALRDPRQGTRPFALREYREIAERSGGTIELLARTFFPLSLAAEDGAPRMAQAELVSGNYFEALRVAPFLGRFFDERADRPGSEPSLVLSHRIWQMRFAADPAVIGRPVRVNGRATVIAGVAPPGFVGATQLVAADLWLPASLYPDLARSASADTVPMFGAIGRLAPNVTADEAAVRLTSLAATLPARAGAGSLAVIVTPATGFGVPPAAQGTVVTLSSILYALMALLTAVACANVAALVLALGAGRSREIAVRLSLGASRIQVARQLLTESLALALAGGVAGTVVAIWLTQALAGALTTPFQYVSYALDVRPDARVFACTALATGLAAVLGGVVPIRHAARIDVVDVLKQSASKGGSRASRRTLDAMVVMQFAVSTTLLVAAGMLVRGYLAAETRRPGFEPRGVLAATLDLDQIRLDRAEGIRLFQDVMERLAALPGVGEVSLTRETPLGPGRAATVVAEADSGPGERIAASARVVSARYFRTLGVAIRQGRSFLDEESARPPVAVAVINQAMADRVWPAASALGRVFRLDDGEPIEVIGIVPDLGGEALTRLHEPTFYRPFPREFAARMTVLMRVQGEPAPFFEEVRRTIGEANRDLAIVDLRTVEQLFDAVLEQRRLPAVVLALIGLLGLLLSAVGLYGVVAYGVHARARELGIRLALGARPADVRRLVLRQGFGIVGLGLAVGGLGTAALAQALRTTLFAAGPLDPWIFAAVGVVLLLSSCAALYVPALWASRVEPVQTLRGE